MHINNFSITLRPPYNNPGSDLVLLYLARLFFTLKVFLHEIYTCICMYACILAIATVYIYSAIIIMSQLNFVIVSGVKFLNPLYISRLTVVSREAKKKQHACESSGLCYHYSELFTWMAVLKFENTIAQPL